MSETRAATVYLDRDLAHVLEGGVVVFLLWAIFPSIRFWGAK